MARTTKPDSIYRVSLHRNGGHTYAATHPYTIDETGRRRYSVRHWGKVTEDLRFIPGKRWREASEEERSRLVFPEGWDVSATKEGAGASGPGIPLPFTAADAGKAFGDVWLLERIVGRFGVREDLCEILGEPAAADDILTLAYYPLLSGTSFLRFPRWQSSTKVPSRRPLEEMVSGALSSVSRKAFHRFMELRRKRHEGERMCAVDSVTRHSSGDAVSDRRWGQKTERIHVQSTVEAVAYSLDAHVPVVYSSFPEAVPDARAMGVFRARLAKAGLGGITVVTDRGYDSLKGLERYFADGPMVMCVDVKQPAVLERIKAFGRFREHPAGMRYDASSRRWYRQYPLKAAGQDLRLNLFFNPERRSAELAQIDAETAAQEAALREIAGEGITIEDRRSLRRNHYFFIISYDAETGKVASFSPDRAMILRTRAVSGFYANVTSGLDVSPLEAVSIYGLKYDQEKFLRHIRSLMMDLPILPARAERLRFGIQLLQYIALLLYTRLRYAFTESKRIASSDSGRMAGQTAPLPFRSVTEILDELHGVGCADSGDGTCVPAAMTPLQQRIVSAILLEPETNGVLSERKNYICKY